MSFLKRIFGGLFGGDSAAPAATTQPSTAPAAVRAPPAAPPPAAPKLFIGWNEMIDAQGGIGGYRLLPRTLNPGQRITGPALLDALTREQAARYAETRPLLIPLTLAQWQEADFKTAVGRQTFILIEDFPELDTATQQQLTQHIRGCGAKLVAPRRIDQAPLPWDVDALLIDFHAEPLTQLESVVRTVRQQNPALRLFMTDTLQHLGRMDVDDPLEDNLKIVRGSVFTRYPVVKGGFENVLGIVQAKDLLHRLLEDKSVKLTESVRPPLYVPEAISPMQLLEQFKRTRNHTALVVDEYGEIEGLVTINDVMEAIVGDLPTEAGDGDDEIVQREDGSWLVDGTAPIADVVSELGLDALPESEAGAYHTMGGFVMARLGRIPRTTDTADWGGMRFEVIDMDGRRIDKLLAQRATPTDA